MSRYAHGPDVAASLAEWTRRETAALRAQAQADAAEVEATLRAEQTARHSEW